MEEEQEGEAEREGESFSHGLIAGGKWTRESEVNL